MESGKTSLKLKKNPMNIDQERKSSTENDDFILYPLYKVVAVFSDDETVKAVVGELHRQNFTTDEVELFCGIDGAKRLDFDGTKHGVWATFVREIQHLGPDQSFLEKYQKDLKEGHCLIMVRAADIHRREIATKILHNHTKDRVNYFGLLLIEEV